MAYGQDREGGAFCTNVQPGSFWQECRLPASWIGVNFDGFEACFCSDCKEAGVWGSRIVEWRQVENAAPAFYLCTADQ